MSDASARKLLWNDVFAQYHKRTKRWVLFRCNWILYSYDQNIYPQSFYTLILQKQATNHINDIDKRLRWRRLAGTTEESTQWQQDYGDLDVWIPKRQPDIQAQAKLSTYPIQYYNYCYNHDTPTSRLQTQEYVYRLRCPPALNWELLSEHIGSGLSARSWVSSVKSTLVAAYPSALEWAVLRAHW